MSHFSLTGGASPFSQDAPTLVLLCALLLAGLLTSWLIVREFRSRRSQKVVMQSPGQEASNIVQELYIDPDGFALMGQDWRWTTNLPVDYGCPECGERVQTTMRQYYHVSGYTFSLYRHRCLPGQDTLPLEAVRKEQR